MNKETFEYINHNIATGEPILTNWTIVDKKKVSAVRDGAKVEVKREKRSWYIYLNGELHGSHSNYATAIDIASLILDYEVSGNKGAIIFSTGYKKDRRGAPKGTDFRDPERCFAGQIQSLQYRWARGGIIYRVHLSECKNGLISAPKDRLAEAVCYTYAEAKLRAQALLESAVQKKQQLQAA